LCFPGKPGSGWISLTSTGLDFRRISKPPQVKAHNGK
jgi:hypothetical protein